jgi:hypothetical protein
MNQNESPRIQPKRRKVQIGQEAKSSATKPAKGSTRKNAVPEEIKNRARQLAEMLGIGSGYAMVMLRNGSKWPRTMKESVTTSVRHMGMPWYWNQCIITQYGQENKAFPDWSCIWTKEVVRRRANELWRQKPIEVKRKRNKRKPKNPERRRELYNLARARRIANNPHFRTINSLRSRFRKFITKGQSQSVRRLLGCSIEDFKKHLESQFTKKMNWGNYGSYWHIDHIMPCSSFDHTDERQISICWHYTNMRPLEAVENMRKGNAIAESQINLLMDYVA